MTDTELAPLIDASNGNTPGAPRKRVLLAVHSAKPAGAQFVALSQARALKDVFDLFISIPDGPLQAEFAEHGELVPRARSLPIWGAPPTRWAVRLSAVIPESVRLARVIRAKGIDAVVVNSTVLAAPVVAARLTRVPSFVHFQEAPKSAAARRIFRFHMAMADTVIAPSRWIADTVADSGRARVVQIPNGIPLPARPPAAEKRFDGPVRLCVIGTIDRHKRQDLAVEALAHLRDRGVDASLELVGPENRPEFATHVRNTVHERNLQDRVQFAGQTNGIDDVLQRSDVLLLPAGEVTPLVLMQALAWKCPVVAADMGSVSDIIIDGQTGLLVPPDDPRGMAAAVESLVSSSELVSRLVEEGRRHVEAEFDERELHRRLTRRIYERLPRAA